MKKPTVVAAVKLKWEKGRALSEMFYCFRIILKREQPKTPCLNWRPVWEKELREKYTNWKFIIFQFELLLSAESSKEQL